MSKSVPTRPRAGAVIALGYVAAHVTGCGAQPVTVVQQKPTNADQGGPAFVSPARWDYHPPAPSAALAAVRVSDDTCVFTADGGQRWMTSPGAAPAAPAGDAGAAKSKSKKPAPKPAGRVVCRGRAEAASALAPEDLVGAIRRADQTWVFIGETGTLYEAADPLGAFTRTVPAPEPFARVAGSGQLILGATFEGRVLRWEEAKGWTAVQKPPGSGATAPAASAPPPARIFDVAVGEGGRAMALGFPEALFTSEDGGDSWSVAATPAVGARQLGRNGAGNLAAQGLFETVAWTPGATPAFARSKDALPSAALGIDPDVSRAPSAAAVLAGRAVLDGDRYLELLRPDGDGDEWRLARGKIEGRLEITSITGTGGCSNMRFGARNRDVFTACVTSQKGDLTAEIRRSSDQGTTWGDPIKLATPDTDQINFAVSSEGTALVTGVCKPAEGSSSCKPNAPLLVRVEAGALKAMVTGAPQLSGLALLPAFSADGRSAYFLGRRGKDDRISLFVSHDAGETFSQRPIEAPAGSAKPQRRSRGDDDEEESYEPNYPDVFEVEDSSSLRPGEDGSLAIGLQRTRYGYVHVLADDDGRVLQVSSPPSEEAIMSGFGRRLVAISATPDGGSNAWESLDGGTTWEAQAPPVALAREFARGSPTIACSLGGCLIGETLARVGWGGQGDAGTQEKTPEAPAAMTPSVLTPIVCDLSQRTKWSKIDHLYNVSYGIQLPEINSTMRRRSVWSALTVDYATGEIKAVSADLPDGSDGDARVVTKTLAAAHPPTQHYATAISRQAEGWAVVRVPFTIEKGAVKAGSIMKNVEVAWENYSAGVSGRARIADAGPFERGDVSPGGWETLDTGLISVTAQGIVVRPHTARNGSRTAFFIDNAGKVEKFDLPLWPSRGLSGYVDLRGDTAAVEGQVLGVGLIHTRNGPTATIVLAHRTGTGKPVTTWDMSAFSLTPARNDHMPLLFETDWSYVGKNALGMTALVADPKHQRAWAHFQGFRGDGTFVPTQPLATMYDLGDRPKPCPRAERESTARFESSFFAGGEPLFPGMRHPVLVVEPPAKNQVGVVEPILLLTAGAVTHGPPSSPCVAGWEAKGVARTQISAVIQGDLAHAFLFRVANSDVQRPNAPRGSTYQAPGMEYRPMTCRFDPAARIPEVIFSDPGTAKN